MRLKGTNFHLDLGNAERLNNGRAFVKKQVGHWVSYLQRPKASEKRKTEKNSSIYTQVDMAGFVTGFCFIVKTVEDYFVYKFSAAEVVVKM